MLRLTATLVIWAAIYMGATGYLAGYGIDLLDPAQLLFTANYVLLELGPYGAKMDIFAIFTLLTTSPILSYAIGGVLIRLFRGEELIDRASAPLPGGAYAMAMPNDKLLKDNQPVDDGQGFMIDSTPVGADEIRSEIDEEAKQATGRDVLEAQFWLESESSGSEEGAYEGGGESLDGDWSINDGQEAKTSQRHEGGAEDDQRSSATDTEKEFDGDLIEGSAGEWDEPTELNDIGPEPDIDFDEANNLWGITPAVHEAGGEKDSDGLNDEKPEGVEDKTSLVPFDSSEESSGAPPTTNNQERGEEERGEEERGEEERDGEEDPAQEISAQEVEGQEDRTRLEHVANDAKAVEGQELAADEAVEKALQRTQEASALGIDDFDLERAEGGRGAMHASIAVSQDMSHFERLAKAVDDLGTEKPAWLKGPRSTRRLSQQEEFDRRFWRWHAVWTSTASADRTQKMRDEAAWIATRLTQEQRTAIMTEGPKGISALASLDRAVEETAAAGATLTAQNEKTVCTDDDKASAMWRDLEIDTLEDEDAADDGIDDLAGLFEELDHKEEEARSPADDVRAGEEGSVVKNEAGATGDDDSDEDETFGLAAMGLEEGGLSWDADGEVDTSEFGTFERRTEPLPIRQQAEVPGTDLENGASYSHEDGDEWGHQVGCLETDPEPEMYDEGSMEERSIEEGSMEEAQNSALRTFMRWPTAEIRTLDDMLRRSIGTKTRIIDDQDERDEIWGRIETVIAEVEGVPIDPSQLATERDRWWHEIGIPGAAVSIQTPGGQEIWERAAADSLGI